jgi:hypothetical protein
MSMDDADIAFLNRQFERFTGWCHAEAAWLTCWLLDVQNAEGRRGAALEIGVYRGKYLSVLYQSHHRRGLHCVGLDTWTHFPMSHTLDAFKEVLGHTDGLSLGSADSTKLDHASLATFLRSEKVGFASIDGEHTASAVHSDLKLVTGHLHRWGIVAVDDFLNSRAIGVGEGVYRYFHFDHPDLQPFCYCGNKLFLANREFVAPYAEAVLAFTGAAGHLSAVRDFLSLKAEALGWVRQTLLGNPVWII